MDGDFGKAPRRGMDFFPRKVFAYVSRKWGQDVEKVNVYSFYEMSRDLRAVAALPDDALLTSAVWTIHQAKTRLNSLVDNGDPIPLGVSKTQANNLRSALAHLDNMYFVGDPQVGRKWEWPKEDARFPDWMVNYFRRSLETFETVFSAEMGEVATYFVPRRGIYNTGALVDTADESFPHELASGIPEKAKIEWRAAGRCLAFNLLSASGFHVARSVESMMEIYYQKFVGDNSDLKNWGNYLEGLEKVATKDGIPSNKTVSEIAQMKDDYRNPLMHPRVVLTDPDARMLFDNGESLIIAMASEIAKAPVEQPQDKPELKVAE